VLVKGVLGLGGTSFFVAAISAWWVWARW